jgi:molybdopterin synthase catalytic subunit
VVSPQEQDWVDVADGPLPVTEALSWAAQPHCGAVVVFCGTVRDFSDGRPGVEELEYEAYLEQVIPRLEAVAAAARARWPELGRVAMLHRVGRLTVGEVAVVVVASTPHRAEAFDATRYCIDTLKATVPIWKRETWSHGSEWGLCSHPIVDVDDDQNAVV